MPDKVYNGNFFDDKDEDENDYDHNTSCEETNTEHISRPSSVVASTTTSTKVNSNYNDAYQTSVSSLASYDSMNSYSNGLPKQSNNKKQNAYQTNPLSVANIIQTNDQNDSNKEYPSGLQNFLASNYDQYSTWQQQTAQSDQNLQRQNQVNVAPKVQAATAYLLQPPDAKQIAQAAQAASNNRNRRRTRVKFEAEHITILENAFQKTHYPDVNLVDKIAEMLKMNTERISIWFQNRRARYKREKHHDPAPKLPQSTSQQPLFDALDKTSCSEDLNRSISNSTKKLTSNTRLARKPSINDFSTTLNDLEKKIPEQESNYDESDASESNKANTNASDDEQTPLKHQADQSSQLDKSYLGYPPTYMYAAAPTGPYTNYNYNYAGLSNFVHPLMYDQQCYAYFSQYQQQQQQQQPPGQQIVQPRAQVVYQNENSISTTTSPSPSNSRSNTPVSQSESNIAIKVEPEFPLQNAYSCLNTDSASGYSNTGLPNAYPGYPLWNLYPTSNANLRNDYQATNYQNSYY